jgi:hypothetical protein
MPRPKEAPTENTKIPVFAHEELEVLVHILRERARERISGPRLLGALVLAARQLPPEVVEALVPAYDERAADFIEIREAGGGN